MTSPAKPAGKLRVLMLGDSFVQGYTVERQDLFVDVLERWWQAEGRDVDVINAGTEGYSTDQEALWLAGPGRAFQPDVVLLFPYQNDLYWNAATSYDRYQKPRINPDGRPELRVLADPGPEDGLAEERAGRAAREALDAAPELDARRRPRAGHGVGRLLPPAAGVHEGGAGAHARRAAERPGDLRRAEGAPRGRADPAQGQHPGGRAGGAGEATSASTRRAGRPTSRPRRSSVCARSYRSRRSTRATHSIATTSMARRSTSSATGTSTPLGNRVLADFLHDELDRRGVFPAAYVAQDTASLDPRSRPKASASRHGPSSSAACGSRWARSTS